MTESTKLKRTSKFIVYEAEETSETDSQSDESVDSFVNDEESEEKSCIGRDEMSRMLEHISDTVDAIYENQKKLAKRLLEQEGEIELLKLALKKQRVEEANK